MRISDWSSDVCSSDLASGAKMGKTAAGAVWLGAHRLGHFDYWQFWRNTEDGDVGRFLRLFTDLPDDEIARLEKMGGAKINEATKLLAFEAAKLCRAEAAAAEEEATARQTSEEGATAHGNPTTTARERELSARLQTDRG